MAETFCSSTCSLSPKVHLIDRLPGENQKSARFHDPFQRNRLPSLNRRKSRGEPKHPQRRTRTKHLVRNLSGTMQISHG